MKAKKNKKQALNTDSEKEKSTLTTNNNKDCTEAEPKVKQKNPEQQEDPNYKELFLRVSADLQNFKRRTEREQGEWSFSIQSELLKKILPLVEDLERAIKTSEEITPEDRLDWLEGFKLILKSWKKTLANIGVEEINTTKNFNPEFHEALMQVENPDVPSGQIVEVLNKGYLLSGKIIKHARVSVSK